MISLMKIPPIRGKKWLLKPNLLTGARPEEGVTTHPEVLRAVIRYFVSRGGVVGVGDSPGVGNSRRAAAEAGMLAVVEEEGAVWVEFKETRRVGDYGGTLVKQFDLTSVLDDWDYLINLPKMKNHQMMYFTGAMKNLFGLIPGLAKSQFHFRFPGKREFAQMLLDLNKAVKPVFSLMDGIVGMEGPGPRSGSPRRIGLLMISQNPFLMDWTAARIMGYNPADIPLLQVAAESGWEGFFLEKSDDSLICRPDSKEPLEVEDLIIHDFRRIKILKETGFLKKGLPQPLYRFLKNLYVPRPVIQASACIACGRCLAICPVEAIVLQPPKIDYSRCIRCYCCHEVCPEEAIKIRRRPF